METNVEHKNLDFMSVSICLALCDEQHEHSFVFVRIRWGRGGQKFLVSSKFLGNVLKKIELYHSCRLLFTILLQHNVVGDGCVCLKLLYIKNPPCILVGFNFIEIWFYVIKKWN